MTSSCAGRSTTAARHRNPNWPRGGDGVAHFPEPIKITGLAEFNRALRRMSTDLPKALRQAQNEAAGIVVDWARPRVPVRSGRAARSVRASSTRTAARVTGGGARVPYYPWLDFG